MPGATFTQGQLVRMSVLITQNSTLVDPLTLSLDVQVDDGAQISIPSTGIVNDSVGAYHHDYDTSTSVGLVEYRWDAATPQGAQESYFIVAASRVPSP